MKPVLDGAKAERQHAVDFARRSVRLEGFVLSPAVEAIFRRYIEGTLTDTVLTAAILEASGVHGP